MTKPKLETVKPIRGQWKYDPLQWESTSWCAGCQFSCWLARRDNAAKRGTLAWLNPSILA